MDSDSEDDQEGGSAAGRQESATAAPFATASTSGAHPVAGRDTSLTPQDQPVPQQSPMDVGELIQVRERRGGREGKDSPIGSGNMAVYLWADDVQQLPVGVGDLVRKNKRHAGFQATSFHK